MRSFVSQAYCANMRMPPTAPYRADLTDRLTKLEAAEKELIKAIHELNLRGGPRAFMGRVDYSLFKPLQEGDRPCDTAIEAADLPQRLGSKAANPIRLSRVSSAVHPRPDP